MKKKIVAMCATVALAALAVGGTLAYFTDTTEVDKNTMTLGNVEIVQLENGVETDGLSFENVTPGTLYDKFVTVENTGDYDAYVRTIFAFENTLGSKGDGSDGIAAMINYKHSPKCGNYEEFEWIDDDVYIDGKYYSVAVATYKEAVAAHATAHASLAQVGLNPAVTSKYVEDNSEFADGYEILVLSQACQEAEMGDDAKTALDTAFGKVTATKCAEWF